MNSTNDEAPDYVVFQASYYFHEILHIRSPTLTEIMTQSKGGCHE
jgi:hypothetical protein